MDIRQIEKNCLSNLLDVLELHELGHTGGSLSILQALISLYYQVARVDPQNPEWPSRDRIVFSKAHACEAMYAVLAEKGYFPKSRLSEFLEFGSMLQGHTERSTPGVEYSGGSLGQGICFACGAAYAAKLRNLEHRVFCIVGDGECHEGSVWEAAMFGAHYKLDNLFVLVDYNHYSDHGEVDDLMRLMPIEQKWKSFGWETRYLQEGNDIEKISVALSSFRSAGKPKCLVLNTIKNFHIPSWEKLHLHQAAGEMLRLGVAEGRLLLNEP